MRPRLLIILILVLLGSFVALAQVGLLSWPFELAANLNLPIPEKWKTPAKPDAPAPQASLHPGDENAPYPQSNESNATEAESKETPPQKNPGAPALTIAQISSNGPSVFGGTAAPFSQVTVLDGSTPVGTATANDRGDWSMVTEYQFANTSPNINLRAGAMPGNATASASELPKISAPPSVAASGHESPATQILKKFEGVVAAAREEA